MSEIVLIEEIIIEKVAEGTVSDVMEKTGHPEESLNVMHRRKRGEDLFQAWIEGFPELARHMHRTQGVLKPSVLRRGIDPSCTLELIDPSQPLKPRGINEVFLGPFGGAAGHGNGKENILIYGISDERLPLVRPCTIHPAHNHGV